MKFWIQLRPPYKSSSIFFTFSATKSERETLNYRNWKWEAKPVSCKTQVPRLEIWMMNLKFKPWILAGIIRHNHSLIDFQATERLIAVYAKRDRRNLAREGMILKGEGGFWLVFIVTWLYCPINNKGAKIKFIWKSVGIHLFVNIRAGGLYFFFLSCVYFIEDSLCGICHLQCVGIDLWQWKIQKLSL